MLVKRLICLANSRKRGGRCVAGKELLPHYRAGEWIRPVSNRRNQAISEDEQAPELAPTQEMLDEYKKLKGDWKTYEGRFLDLMCERKVEEKMSKVIISEGCLLCSEEKPHFCHRRLVAEYLNQHWGGEIEIAHLE